jgi:hypothetical protein
MSEPGGGLNSTYAFFQSVRLRGQKSSSGPVIGTTSQHNQEQDE